MCSVYKMDDREMLEGRERDVFEAIRRAIHSRGRPISLDEAARAAGLYDKSHARKYILPLVEKEYLRQLEGHRGIELAEGSGLILPNAGLVAAGPPIATCEPPSDTEFNFREAFGGDGNFVVEVRGDSMRDDHIADGDILVVRPANIAEDGQRVVCRIDDGRTVKIYRIIRGAHWLYACNNDVPPRKLNPKQENQIEGVVVGVVRKC